MISISGPFTMIFNMATRGLKPHTYKRLGTVTLSGLVGLAKSNYFRKLGVADEIAMNGYTFVILKSDITAISGVTGPVRGDVIEHVNFGTLTIDQIDPIEDGTTVFAYRIVTV